jgi:RHS repeat-associated protein
MSHTDRIQRLLSQKPGLKAQQIANELGLDRSQVAAALDGLLGSEVSQDSTYRWWPKTRPPQESGGAAAPRTFLASLCRYYLECLAHESSSGISIPAAACDAGYVVLNELPFARRGDQALGTERAVKRMVQKVRRERGRLALYVGYAIRLRSARLGNEEEMRLEPVLLYPIEETPEDPDELLRPASGIPLFNLEVLKNLPSADSGNVMDEAIHLSEELGLANAEDDLPPWDEVILRLRHCRPEWDWQEDLNPYALSRGAPLAELSAPGIYNRAVLFAGTRSPFTYGLETELRKLAQLDDEAVRDTALGLWLRGESVEAALPEEGPILELLPLNTEQRQAVLQGLSAPLTVVTGPPGTGKSQVVISLLANLAWQGGSVLFASGATTYYVYDARGLLMAEYGGGALTSGTRYVVTDHLGSTRLLLDETGTCKSRMDYAPFGAEVERVGEPCYTSSTEIAQKFTGKERDGETSLDYFGARYFSGAQGRFTTPDPLLNTGRPWEPQSWNRYAYALNNPLRYTDPTGLYEWDKRCKDGDQACEQHRQQFRDALANLQKAASSIGVGSKERKQLDAILVKIGTEGDRNKIRIAFNDKMRDFGQTFGNKMTFNFQAIDQTLSKWDSATVSTAKAALVGHEAEHLVEGTGLVGGLKYFLNWGDERVKQEIPSHTIESYVFQGSNRLEPFGYGLGVLRGDPQGWPLWNPSWAAADADKLREENVRKYAQDRYGKKP